MGNEHATNEAAFGRIENVDGIDPQDAPKYCDAFISYAERDGVALTEEELDAIPSEVVHEYVMEAINGSE